MLYSHDDISPGGTAEYRCGTPGELQFAVRAEYLVVEAEHLVVHTETVRMKDQVLASGVVSWAFTDQDDGVLVSVTNQVTSFVGEAMLDGTRNGHAVALEQLAELLKS